MIELTIHEISRARYDEMLREAELERRAHRAKQAQPRSHGNPLLVHVGNWLIESGSWLKQQNEMRPGLS